jgi:hypothetical protein
MTTLSTKALALRTAVAISAAMFSSLASSEDLLSVNRFEQNLQGSLNTISGTGTLLGGQVLLPIGATLTRLEFELLSFNSSPDVGLPQSLTLSFVYLYPGSSVVDAVGISFSNFSGIQIGDTVSIDPFGAAYNVQNPYLGLFSIYPQSIPQIRGGASWNFGDVNTFANSEIEMRTYGVAALIPEPNGVLLMMAGLVLLRCAIGRKS